MSSSASQPSKPPKINEKSFQISIGFLLGIAIVVAGARIIARYLSSHRISIHDGFFFLALATFISGTTVLYFDIPYIYLQENVEAGLRTPPPDLVSQLIHSVKLQYSAATLLGTAIMGVKFSFLFFFRALIQRQKTMMKWWWCILALLIPTTPILMFSDFIACPYTDERIIVECITPQALDRQNGILRAVAILDIITDILLISVPVMLLWNVKISLRRKFSLWGVLCLSIFTMITAIVKIAGGNISHGQVDSAWAIFWEQAEAAVAIIVVSVSAFRALFIAHRASKQSPAYKLSDSGSIWSRTSKSRGDQPSVPPSAFTGVKTLIRRSPHDECTFNDSQDTELPLRGPQILVTHNVSSEINDRHEPQKHIPEYLV